MNDTLSGCIVRAAVQLAESQWLDIESAPKDGTLVLLLVPMEGRLNPLEDTAGLSRSIGHNNFDNDGDDEWLFAGWCWSHDHYTEGKGKPVAWRPLPDVSPKGGG